MGGGVGCIRNFVVFVGSQVTIVSLQVARLIRRKFRLLDTEDVRSSKSNWRLKTQTN